MKDENLTKEESLLMQHNKQYQHLVDDIGNLLTGARQKVANSINTILVDTYWQIGRYIVEYEQKGEERAEYGSHLLSRLSKDLTHKYGKGFEKSNLLYMRKLYNVFPISGTLSHLLSWSHYYEILKADDKLEISFYIKECEKEKWSVRELKRQMKSMLFHRIALGKDKEGILDLAQKGIEVQKPEDVIKDPYVLEFLGFPEQDLYNESSLEEALINSLGKFMLELGKGFILGANADKLTMEYAMANISNNLFVSRYQLYLPDREMLENELKRVLGK